MSETHVTIIYLQKALLEEIAGRRKAEMERDRYRDLALEIAEQRDAAVKEMSR